MGQHCIQVNGIIVYAFHGCLPQETLIGANYEVNIKMHTNFEEAALTDNLTQTIDYCQVYEIVKHEMAIASKLIETVAKRIMVHLKSKIQRPLYSCSVEIIKINPPMNGNVANVSVCIVE
jgi:7,8-dihydroneopterin aldolase/epimerase/oxygenase